MGLTLAFFGSSLVSAYWNGAATYYRGILSALHARGHRTTFFEPDAYDRQSHRDIDDPEFAEVVVYESQGTLGVTRALESASSCDLIVKASGVGVFDELLEREVLALRRPGQLVVFWDVDAPATLDRVEASEHDPFRELIPRYDMILTYGGGPPVVERYRRLGARACVPIYNGLDPDTHHPVALDPRFLGDLGFLGNRLPDREARVDKFLFRVAERLPLHDFVLAGSGWQDKPRPENVRYLGHLYTREHNAFNSTLSAVLNVNRESMASTGYSPATRVFEAAGAGACIISDAWTGIDEFFEPGREILVARDEDEVIAHVLELTPARRRQIGEAARRRALAQHTYARRAIDLEKALSARPMELAS